MRAFDPEIWREVTGGAVADRVRRLIRVTPLVPAPALGRRTGADVWLKLENLQRTGSFKLRGAAARLAAVALEDRTPKRQIIADQQWNTVQEEDQQNRQLLDLSHQILELTKAVHGYARLAAANTGASGGAAEVGEPN